MRLLGLPAFFRAVELPSPFDIHPESSAEALIDFYSPVLVESDEEGAAARSRVVVTAIIANRDALAGHIGSDSTFAYKASLIECLGIIRTALESEILSDDAKLAITTKLNECIDECSPGFFNRVKGIVESFFEPQEVDELLAWYRRELVIEATNHYADSDIHANQCFFAIANSEGWAIPIIEYEDPHFDGLDIGAVAGIISEIFAHKYTSVTVLTEPFRQP